MLPAWWVSHVELTWGNRRIREFLAALAERQTVIRYDALGTGLSERRRRDGDFSLQFEAAVLAELLDELGLRRCTLLGFSSAGPVASAFTKSSTRMQRWKAAFEAVPTRRGG